MIVQIVVWLFVVCGEVARKPHHLFTISMSPWQSTRMFCYTVLLNIEVLLLKEIDTLTLFST